jgi:hypothetical protein
VLAVEVAAVVVGFADANAEEVGELDGGAPDGGRADGGSADDDGLDGDGGGLTGAEGVWPPAAHPARPTVAARTIA